VRASWLPGDAADRFWYRVTTEKGVEIVLVDPGKAAKSACDLPPCKAAEREDPARAGAGAGAGRYAETSPDKKRVAFVRDWNLWVRDVATGRETALTKDGVKDFGYATDNAGWARSDRPILRWSPDSKKIATFQQDERNVGEMYLVDTGVGHPKLQAWKYPLAGDQTDARRAALQHIHQLRQERRIVLTIAVDGDDDRRSRGLHPGAERRRLSAGAGVADLAKPRMHRPQARQFVGGCIGRTVVDVDHLEGPAGQRRGDLRHQRRDVSGLVPHRNNDRDRRGFGGIRVHGAF